MKPALACLKMACLLAILSSLTFATRAMAQDDGADKTSASDAGAPPPPPPPPPSTAAQTIAKMGDAVVSSIERLPPSAYQQVPIRGIPGGSLAATFHGLQFPYYPKTGIRVSGYGLLDSGY